MKNLFKILLAVVALAVVGCTTDTTDDLAVDFNKGNGQTTITLSLDGTRTHLGAKGEEGYPLYWSKGDQIALNGVASAPLGEEFDGQSAATFTFEGDLTAPYNVVYPAPAEGVVASVEGLYPVVFPASQEYVEGGFADGAAPLYGYAGFTADGDEVGAIEIGHLTGVLRFAVKGETTLRTLTITTETGSIAGTFDVDCSNGSLTPQEGASNTVTMSFGTGLKLNAETATPIYVTVPAGDYGKINVMLSSTTDIMKLTFDSTAKPVKAGVVREFAEFAFAANASESDIYLIDSKEALIHFAEIASNFSPYTTAKVVAPIDMTGEAWTPIEGFGEFVFDGGEQEIKGLSAPLFGSTAGIIKNVKLTGVNINETEAAFTGAIARRLYGSLNNCSAAGAINVNNTTLVLESYTNAYSDLAHGGLVGMASGATVYNSTNDVDVTVTSFCVADFTCKASIGGVVGASENSSMFNGLTNNGDVVYNGTTQKGNVYMSGIVGKKSNVSGMAYIAEFSNCTNNGAVYTAEGSVISADLLISGGTGDIAFGEAEAVCDKLVNNGDITHKGKCKNIRMAGLLTYDATVSMTNCSNSGDISIAKGAEASEVRISGITAGEIKAESYSNCTNSGAISFATGAKATKAWLSGISNDIVYAETYSGCTNSGAISIGDGNQFNGEVWIAGVGILVKGIADKNSVIKNCTNSGPVSVGAATQKSTAQAGRLYVSGVINRSEGADVLNCYNEATGTVTVKTGAWGSGYMIAGFISYWGYVGGVASYDVTDCENRADILIEPATAEGVTSAPYAELGGVSSEAYVGSGDYTINFTRVKNSGNITVKGTYTSANYPYLGGIIGVNNYTTIVMKDCENSGNISYAATAPSASVGGIFGYDTNNTSFTIDGCVNSGNIAYSGIAGTHVSLGGFCGYRNVSKPTVITNSTNLGTVTLSGEQTATQTESWAYAVAGFVGRNNGAGLSVSDSTNGKLNDATKGTVTVGTAPSGIGLAGVVGISTSVATLSGCTNYGTIKLTGASETCLLGGVIGCQTTGNLTITDCKNAGTVTNLGAVAASAYLGGIVSTHPVGNLTITDCENAGVVTNSGIVTASAYLGGIVGEYTPEGTITITGSKNTGKVELAGEQTAGAKDATRYFVGGVLGKITAPAATATISKCTNGVMNDAEHVKGIVTVGSTNSSSATAGIVAYSLGVLSISECVNYGTVTLGGEYAGFTSESQNWGAYVAGVLGVAYKEGGVTTITNCENAGIVKVTTKTVRCRPEVGGICGRAFANAEHKISNCRNSGKIYAETANNIGKEASFGGIIGTLSGGLLTSCNNLETGVVEANAGCSTNFNVAGIAGSTNGALVQITSCNNYAEIKQVKHSAHTTQFGGIVGYAYTFGTIDGCNNFGKVTIMGADAGDQVSVGGVIGYARFRRANATDDAPAGVSTISNCANYADQDWSTTRGASTFQGGVVGYCRPVETGEGVVSNLKNVANIKFGGTVGTPYFGGLCGFLGKTTVIDGGVCYGNMFALGKEGESGYVGFCVGVARTDTCKVKDVQIGGNMVYAQQENPYYDTMDDILTPLTDDNLGSYVYNKAIETSVVKGDGCTFLSAKPAVPAN